MNRKIEPICIIRLRRISFDETRFKNTIVRTLIMNFTKYFIPAVFLSLISFSAMTQVIPPGLGDTKMAGWMAFGIQQDLDTVSGKGWSSTSYFGFGRMSDPDNYNLLQKPAIFILNQEFKNKFSEKWEYSLAFSYRNQKNYSDTEPYERTDPASKQEFRLYGRLSRIFKTSFVEITPTFRQELQKYFTGDFGSYPESFRLRSRFRVKFKVPLSMDEVHKLSLYSEQLFSTSLKTEPNRWTPFEYKDSRFSLYYTLSPKEIPWDFNMGYMNNLIGKKAPFSAHYVGLDLIWKNPF